MLLLHSDTADDDDDDEWLTFFLYLLTNTHRPVKRLCFQQENKPVENKYRTLTLIHLNCCCFCYSTLSLSLSLSYIYKGAIISDL